MDTLKSALEASGLIVASYDASLQRNQITLKDGSRVSLPKFTEALQKALLPIFEDHTEAFKLTQNASALGEALGKIYAPKVRELPDSQGYLNDGVPPEWEDYVLNLNPTRPGRESEFFLTLKIDNSITKTNAWDFITALGLDESNAKTLARKHVPIYAPREDEKIFERVDDDGITRTFQNTYMYPQWRDFDSEIETERLPRLVEKLFHHLFPTDLEREYVAAWVAASLVRRSEVYLVLNGKGGIGKTTFKKLLFGLHGRANWDEGAQSTFQEKFNNQIFNTTFVWFDELSYNEAMSNKMKKSQDGITSKESKGVDAAKQPMHASFAISNNEARDNYIQFDSRKFAAVLLNNKRLESSMAPVEIGSLISCFDEGGPGYDGYMVAQTARWFIDHGTKFLKRWPNLEYRGPMFWRLAHTSMSRWQKITMDVVKTPEYRSKPRPVNEHPEKGFLWSEIQTAIAKRMSNLKIHNTIPDATIVISFFQNFRDVLGRTSFKVERVRGSPTGDFYVKVILPDMCFDDEETLLSDIEWLNKNLKVGATQVFDETHKESKEKKKLDLSNEKVSDKKKVSDKENKKSNGRLDAGEDSEPDSYEDYF